MNNEEKTERHIRIKEQVALLRREREEKARNKRRNIMQWTAIIALFVVLCAAWAVVRYIDAGIIALR